MSLWLRAGRAAGARGSFKAPIPTLLSGLPRPLPVKCIGLLMHFTLLTDWGLSGRPLASRPVALPSFLFSLSPCFIVDVFLSHQGARFINIVNVSFASIRLYISKVSFVRAVTALRLFFASPLSFLFSNLTNKSRVFVYVPNAIFVRIFVVGRYRKASIWITPPPRCCLFFRGS